MKLIRLARVSWEVLAVLDARDKCPVLDLLNSLDEAYKAAREGMKNMMEEYTPEHGPPKHNEALCKALGGQIFEFRRQPKGVKLRTIFFYDDNKRIVFVNGFTKAETTPQEKLAAAREVRRQYIEAKFRRELEISDRGKYGY
jgi:hypothetical protein